MDHFKYPFSSFSRVHQNWWFWLKIKTTKWLFWALKHVPLFIKSVKDSKNVIESQRRPLNHTLLQNPLKNLCGRYFKKRPWEFLDIHLELIFSRSLIMWYYQNSLKCKWSYKRTVWVIIASVIIFLHFEQLCIVSVRSYSLVLQEVNNQLKINKQLTSSNLLIFHT